MNINEYLQNCEEKFDLICAVRVFEKGLYGPPTRMTEEIMFKTFNIFSWSEESLTWS